MRLTEAEGQVAAPGNLDGILQCLRQVGEQRRHFRRGAQVLLLAVKPWAGPGSASTYPVWMHTRASCASNSSGVRKRTSLVATTGKPLALANRTAAWR